MTKYTSASINHILSYKYVSLTLNYLLSFSLIAVVYRNAIHLGESGLDAVTKYPVINNNLKFVDIQVDALVLCTLDKILAVPGCFKTTIKGVVDDKLAVVNKYYFETINKYLPGSKIDLEMKSEVEKVGVLSNEVLMRLKNLVKTSSNSLSNHLIQTYNQQYDADKTTGSTKRVVVTIKAIKALINDVNSTYVTPLKVQTQGYVNDMAMQTKTKADTLISDAKQGIPKFSLETTFNFNSNPSSPKSTAPTPAAAPVASSTAVSTPPVSASA